MSDFLYYPTYLINNRKNESIFKRKKGKKATYIWTLVNIKMSISKVRFQCCMEFNAMKQVEAQ